MLLLDVKKMTNNLDLTKNKITRNLDHRQLVGSLQTQRESEEAGMEIEGPPVTMKSCASQSTK